MDAQSVKNTDTAALKGYDAGKKVSGIKRHIAVDTQGLPHAVAVTTAEVTDRNGALRALQRCKCGLKRVQSLLCDSGYPMPDSHETAWLCNAGGGSRGLRAIRRMDGVPLDHHRLIPLDPEEVAQSDLKSEWAPARSCGPSIAGDAIDASGKYIDFTRRPPYPLEGCQEGFTARNGHVACLDRCSPSKPQASTFGQPHGFFRICTGRPCGPLPCRGSLGAAPHAAHQLRQYAP